MNYVNIQGRALWREALQETEDDAAGPFSCMYCGRGTDSDDDICDSCRSETCRGCGVTLEQHRHCNAPCPFTECPFKEVH